MTAICETHVPTLKKISQVPQFWRQQLDQTCGRTKSARTRHY